MKPIALLTALSLVMAGCASAPERSPGPAAEVKAPAVAAPDPVSADPAPAFAAPEAPSPVATAPAPEAPAPVAVAPAPAPVAPAHPAPSDRLNGMTRVAPPAPAELGAAYQDPDRRNQSAWATAEAALHFIYTGRAGLENNIAPALVEPLRQTPPAARVWTTWVGSWDEQQERFYFHLQVTVRDQSGAVRRAGVDIIEVSSIPGYGQLVTGFAHAPWASEQGSSPVHVWTGAGPKAYQAPREVPLPALPVAENGRYLVPLAVLGEIGQVRKIGPAAYVVDLTAGSTSGEMTTVLRGGRPFVDVEALTAALRGTRGALPDASGTYSYQAEWRPNTRQLFLWADLQQRSS